MNKKIIKVGICDDECLAITSLKKYVLQCMEELSYTCIVKTYKNAQSLIEQEIEFDILFLDVEIPDMDGFDIANKLKIQYPDMKIAFVTIHRERVQDAFKVGAYRYLYKPLDYVEIKEVLTDLIEEFNLNLGIILTNNGTTEYVKPLEILYIESVGDESAINRMNGTQITSYTLKYLEQQLGDIFFRCHKSYLVNFFHIEKVDKDEVIIDNGDHVPVSVRKRTAMKRTYQEFIIKYARRI